MPEAYEVLVMTLPLLLLALLSILAYSQLGGGAPAETEEPVQAPQGPRRGTAMDRMMRGRRQRERANGAVANDNAEESAAAAADGPAGPDGEMEEEEQEDGLADDAIVIRGGKKKKAKNKAAKKAMAEYRDQMRAEQEQREEKKRDIDADREAESEARWAEKEAEAARIAEEKRAAEQAEYDKWKDMFSTEEAGDAEQETSEESQGLLTEFVAYIQKHKVVVLDDLAQEFGLRTEEVISRVRGLQEMGRITGVIDDRGKFIYISEDEMKAVAAFINKKGRVSVAELAAHSNTLIDLTDTSTDE